MPLWARAITALAVGRVAVGVAVFLAGRVDTSVPSPMPAWAYALLATSFALVGGTLVVSNKRDARAAWLGGILTLLAVPLSERLVVNQFAAIGSLRPDIFLPAFLWHFVIVFPSTFAGRFRQAAAAVARVIENIAAIVFVLMLSGLMWPVAEHDDWRGRLLPISDTGSLYWPVTFVADLAAMLVLLSRSIGSGGTDRFRLRVFASGLLGGLAPLFIEVIVEESVPAYKAFVHRPGVEPIVAALLFVPMATVPFVVAYSVLYDRVVETRVVLRLAAQYLLAKATIVVMSIVPFAALALYLYENRAESVAALLAGPRPVALLLVFAAGISALRLRQKWLAALDRRYFREAHDAQALLARLVASDWISETPQAIAAALTRELDAAFHARVELFVIDPGSGELRNARDGSGALDVRSTLAALVSASPQPMAVDLGGDSSLARLPEAERAWLKAGDCALLVPLRTRSVDLIAILALGRKQSELPYTEAERRELMAIVTPVALSLENNRLRSNPDSHTSPPAGECQSCSRVVQEGRSDVCVCGGRIAAAAVPYLLRGVYRFERRLGAGGMGVVYLARDLNLARAVAIKTLPHLAPRYRARLQSEAQAMASMVDGNLAVIYGMETWRGVPFLVEEYLDGGTLGWRMQRGPMEINEAIDLMITLAGALQRLHDAGIIHCDIKPSNIGFTASGVPKLIDFGLARIIGSADDTLTSGAVTGHDVTPHDDALSTGVTRNGIVGTPAYMSPEALTASIPDRSFDVWALSVVLFEAIAGHRPFPGKTFADVSIAIFGGSTPDLRATRRDCSDRVADFFTRALSRDTAQRPADAFSLQQELLALRGARA